MPHKRNPITTERITGLARVLRGYAQAGLENVALWHERDISHSGAERVILPDATIGARLHAAPRRRRVASGMTVHAERMRENLDLTHGAIYSQRALTALIDAGSSATTPTGSSRRTPSAPGTRGRRSATCSRRRSPSGDLEVDLDAVFDPGAYLRHAGEVFERLEALR